MEVLQLVKKLRQNVGQIHDLFLKKIPAWKSDPKHYDKTRYGFVEGDNDGWYKGATVELHFGAWAGTYGDSSTYKQIELDGNIFREHFIKYLNSNKEKIMMEIAHSMESAASEMVSKATKELNTELDILKELTVS